jgi:hypothetical protein
VTSVPGVQYKRGSRGLEGGGTTIIWEQYEKRGKSLKMAGKTV